MSNTAQQVAQMVDMLPDEEQFFALEFVKRLILAWDPDYTKVTSAEAAVLRVAEEEFARGEITSEEDIDWS